MDLKSVPCILKKKKRCALPGPNGRTTYILLTLVVLGCLFNSHFLNLIGAELDTRVQC